VYATQYPACLPAKQGVRRGGSDCWTRLTDPNVNAPLVSCTHMCDSDRANFDKFTDCQVTLSNYALWLPPSSGRPVVHGGGLAPRSPR
jgi:hypothetical protein